MNPFKVLFVFVLFLSFFLSALTLHFYEMVYQGKSSYFEFGILITLVLFSGIFLALIFQMFSTKTKSFINQFLLGVFISSALFFSVLLIENQMSEERFKKVKSADQFSELRDHCGVYAGRSLLKLIDLNFGSPMNAAIREFKIANFFRLKHFAFLEQNGLLECNAGEEPLDCRLNWMSAFADRGFWNYDSRIYFFEDAKALWERSSKKDDSLMAYVLKDQELESNRHPLLRQIGFEEELSSSLLLIQQQDELLNLKLSQRIFQELTPLLAESKGAPSPIAIKFKDAIIEFQPKLSRIQELEKDITALKQKKSI